MRIRLRKHEYVRPSAVLRTAVVVLVVLGLASVLWATWSALAPPPPARVIYVRAYMIPGVNDTTTVNVGAVFEPSTIIVARGTVVTLRVINLIVGPEPCSFELDGYGLHSGAIPHGGVWEVIFAATQAGVFVFYCEYHGPYMAGVLNVVEG